MLYCALTKEKEQTPHMTAAMCPCSRLADWEAFRYELGQGRKVGLIEGGRKQGRNLIRNGAESLVGGIHTTY